MFILTIICSLFINKNKDYTDGGGFYRKLLYGCTKLVVFFGRIHIHVTGAEKIPEERFLLIQNHRSNFDPILSWHVMKEANLAFISKPENFEKPVMGKLVKRCGFLAIDRENPRNAIKTLMEAAERIKSGVFSIGLYPEGTRNTTEDPLLPFHNGTLKIAKIAEAPILVSAVRGTDQIKNNFPWRATDVYIDILETVSKDEVREKRTGEIADRAVSEMLEVLAPDAER